MKHMEKISGMCYNMCVQKFYRGYIVRKCLIVSGLSFCIACGVSGAYAQEVQGDITKLQVFSEIGSLANTGYYEDALEKCSEALKKYPKEAELYYWSGMVKSKLGDNKSAIKEYDTAISLDPKNSSAYVMRGISKSDLDDYNGAIADYNKAISINAKDSSAYSMRACVKIQMGDIDGALKDMQEANKLMDEEAESKASVKK